MAELSWGKPRIFLKKIGTGTKWFEVPTPAEGTTELQTSKGDKTEAKIEGGENEAVKYSKNTYALVYNIRAAKGRKKPVADSDGVIDGEYELMLKPETEGALGLHMKRSKMSVEDTFSAADGGMWNYSNDALKPEDGGDQVEWGTVTVTGSNGEITPTFTEAAETGVE